MSVRNLEALFAPRSVAVIGASRDPAKIGGVVMGNLLRGRFAGPIMPVNPNAESVAGVLAYPAVTGLPVVPDLAVICTPAATVPGLVADLGRRGTRAIAVLSAGLGADDGNGRSWRDAALAAARPHLTRLLGPNSVGLAVAGLGLNASFAHAPPLPGRLAFVSQSGALCTAVLDWARAKGIGFSHFVSLGDAADVDFGDVIDYLASEPGIDAILLYIESVTGARKFMSAARAAARNKPVVAVKAGRVAEGARAAMSHTGALAGEDIVYDAALARAGVLRVREIDELFSAVETLAHAVMPRGDALAILTNGGGPGVMAADALVEAGGGLAALSEETLARLDAVLPATWSRGNPVDIIGDAGPERFTAALDALLAAPEVDALLVLNAPTAMASALESARAVAGALGDRRRCVLTSWLGEETADAARRVFAAARVPTYATPEQAVRAFRHIRAYQTNQVLLMETPPATMPAERPASARTLIDRALHAGRATLTEPEAKDLLAAYGIPVVPSRLAADAASAAAIAAELGGPVALKVLSPDISHKTDVGGVVLDLETPEAVAVAARAMAERIARLAPAAQVDGFIVQPMARRPRAHELIVGLNADPVFGPVVLFGHGGTAVEVLDDRAIGLPPLNRVLARAMIARTRIANLLVGYRDRPAVDHDAVADVLVRLADMVIDLPEIAELDINPLWADETGVLALDARVRLDRRRPRPAIRPYPRDLEETVELAGRAVLLRPIRPEDEPAHRRFLDRLTPEDIRFRFFGMVRDLPHTQLARFTQIDYEREMAFIATASDAGGVPETLGVVRAVTDPDNRRAEFAIVVRSDLKGAGLGRRLLDKMIHYLRARGTGEVVGQTLPENRAMVALARSLGFATRALREAEVVELVLDLREGD